MAVKKVVDEEPSSDVVGSAPAAVHDVGLRFTVWQARRPIHWIGAGSLEPGKSLRIGIMGSWALGPLPSPGGRQLVTPIHLIAQEGAAARDGLKAISFE